MDKEKTIELLNSIITINNDRIQGYETAAKETEDQELKTLFGRFASTSHTCKSQLVSEVNKLSGKPAEGTMTSGKFFRVWMDVKASLTGNDRKAILNSCEYGEDVAVETYNKALRNNLSDITAEQQAMLNVQHTAIKADHNKVKSMLDSLTAV